MNYPSCGSVLVIDDEFSEAMPLLNLLGKRHISTAYFSGKYNEFPDEPFNTVRLIFCDLKFNVATDSKSVASNVVSILNKLVATNNGPYILLIWSTHENDYVEDVKAALNTAGIKPEFIIQLQKADYFRLQDDTDSLTEAFKDRIKEIGLDLSDNDRVMRVVDTLIPIVRAPQHIPIDDSLEKIEAKLAEELKKANLFYLFVIWENTIRDSAVQTVNSIYSEIPETIPPDKRLKAMIYYLSNYRLDKQMETADLDAKFTAALETINEMFGYFYTENTYKLNPNTVGIDTIQRLQETQELTPARFNKWMMIESCPLLNHVGSVYEDQEKRFCFHGWINSNIITDKDKYDASLAELQKETDIRYIFIDLSSECDIAQRKRFVARLLPGALIPSTTYDRFVSDKKLKTQPPDYITVFKQVEIEGKSYHIAFNLNQMYPMEVDKLSSNTLVFGLTKSYVFYLKQSVATCVYKQGYGIMKDI